MRITRFVFRSIAASPRAEYGGVRSAMREAAASVDAVVELVKIDARAGARGDFPRLGETLAATSSSSQPR